MRSIVCQGGDRLYGQWTPWLSCKDAASQWVRKTLPKTAAAADGNSEGYEEIGEGTKTTCFWYMLEAMIRQIAIYTRVSTGEQTPDNQLQELRAVAERMGWQIAAEYVDQGISGAKGRDRRPGYDRLYNAIVRREIGLLMAWSVDRFGRSLQQLVALLSNLQAKGVFVSAPAGGRYHPRGW